MDLFRFILLFIGLVGLLHASPTKNSGTGVALTYPLIATDPDYLTGYRFALWYQPPTFIWGHFRIYFDGSFAHWRVMHAPANRELNIYALAPVFRYYFTENNFISPFLDASIGLAYLTRTKIADHNLGMHFSFQDQLGLGASFGAEQRLFASLSAMHYSNGSLCGNNRGISIPLLINVGYRF